MACADKPQLPFRWSFVPAQNARDGSIRWTWRALTHTGQVAMESQRSFDSFTDCLEDAKTQGYGQR